MVGRVRKVNSPMTITQVILLVMGLVVVYWAVRLAMGRPPRG